MLKKLKGWILPKEIDFFESLHQQSLSTKVIIDEMAKVYIEGDEKNKQIFELIAAAKQLRKKNLQELNSTFITPVDKEAISRAYIHLHWIVLSVKHLVVEINAYQIYQLNNYHQMFELLCQEITELSAGFKILDSKEYDEVLKKIYEVIHLDNLLIKEYATILATLFKGNDMQQIFEHKEILSQMKEISKRIHFCANQLEDIVFKMN